jgi:hypothetical protein
VGRGRVNRGDEDEGIGLMGFICINRNRMMKPLVIALSKMGRGSQGKMEGEI